MKLIFTIMTLLLCNTAYTQWGFFQTFESPNDTFNDKFIIDTVNYPNNVWQIGKPQKTVFDSAYSYPNAIVTDTLNPYPVNDTSVFMIKVVSHYSSGSSSWFVFVGLQFNYQLDLDSGEIAKIEILTDSGTHWVNVLDEDTTYDIQFGHAKPDFSKSTNGWQLVNIYFDDWAERGQNYPHQIWSQQNDTTYIRFTFISDSIQTNKDGWILDNIFINNLTRSIETVTNNSLISIYPNPAGDYIYIMTNYNYYSKPEVVIYNLQGQEVYATKELPKSGYLHVNLPAGMYTLVYSTGTERAVKQLVIRK